MKKSRIIATILTVTMAFSVTACSGQSEKGEETTVAVTTESAEGAESAEIAEGAEGAEDTEGLMKVNASDTDAGTIDAALVGTWEVSYGEGADKITLYYTYNDDGTGNIVWSDAQSGKQPPQEFKYTTKNGDTLIMNNSETHSEGAKYKIEGDTLTEDDGLQVTTYTKTK